MGYFNYTTVVGHILKVSFFHFLVAFFFEAGLAFDGGKTDKFCKLKVNVSKVTFLLS